MQQRDWDVLGSQRASPPPLYLVGRELGRVRAAGAVISSWIISNTEGVPGICVSQATSTDSGIEPSVAEYEAVTRSVGSFM
jgi:hypothetical protein